MQLTQEWTNELARRYSEPHRRYHTLAHVEELLTLLREFTLDDRDSVEAAVWFHDAIYDTRASDNEARSAELAASALREMHQPNIETVQAMINATATHDPSRLTRDGLLFLDADLSILGAPPERYRAYADAIRAEYAWVPDAMFAAGRAAILRRLLERPSIYQTGEMRARFETQARENVSRELATLESPAPNSRSA
jgi:predicted metal-dependent HD superfamily phosphohydrolase